MKLYHCSTASLAVGSVIKAGNWGRIIQKHYNLSDMNRRYVAYREASYEYARRIFAPAAPSRLECSYGCPTVEEASEFRNTHSPMAIIYEVELLDTNAPTKIASWASVDQLPQDANFELLTSMIQRYWQETPDTGREVLVGGDLRIVGTTAF